MEKILLILALLASFAFTLTSDAIPEKPEDISPLLVGEKIPTKYLTDARGQTVDLKNIISKQATILIFYQGGWCHFCIKHLASIQSIERELLELGWQIIVISPDSPENLKNTIEKQNLSLPLFSDADMQLSKNMGIAFKSTYGKMLIEKSGGKNTEHLLPIPAVFAVDKSGKIRFEHINPDFKDCISVAFLLAVAKAIK